jgi:ubiquinone/menaquinone biosynthesis C-methylase UbiE
MTRGAAEAQTIKEFDAWYAHMRAPVMMAIERSVCGCDYGGTSWTTRAQAERIGEALGLAPGKLLLEVGAGSGWPALYLAKRSGCSAILTDLPEEGLRLARERAAADGLADRCRIVQADGTKLPLDDGSVDAISHSDVLCCLADKLGVLRECRRTIRASGCMAFPVIFVAAGLSPQDHAEAVAAGPPFVESETDYQTLLARTGWRVVEAADLTATFIKSTRAMLEVRQAHREELKALLGASEYDDMIAHNHEKIPAIERGLLRRVLFIAEPKGA